MEVARGIGGSRPRQVESVATRAVWNHSDGDVWRRILSVLYGSIERACTDADETLERTVRLAIQAESFGHHVGRAVAGGRNVAVTRHSTDSKAIVVATDLLQGECAVGLNL